MHLVDGGDFEFLLLLLSGLFELFFPLLQLFFLLLLLKRLDKIYDSLLELVFISRDEQMVVSASLFALQGVLDLGPVAIAEPVGHAEENDVGLFAEELRLLSRVGQSHFVVWVGVLLNLFSDDVWSTHVERYIFLGFLNSLLDLIGVVKSVNLLKEHDGILLDLLRSLGTLHVFTDVGIISRREKFESLQELLEFSSLPFNEAFGLNEVLFDFHFWSECVLFDALNVAIVLGLHFDLKQLLQSFRVWEESKVSNLGQPLLQCLVGDAYIAIGKDVGAKTIFSEVSFDLSSGGFRRLCIKHGDDVLLQQVFGVLSLLLQVVDILKLVQVAGIHVEIERVKLVVHQLFSLLVDLSGLVLSLFDHVFDVLVVNIRPNFEDGISTVVHHIFQVIFLHSCVLGRHSTLLDDERIKFELHRLFLNHFFLHGIFSDKSVHSHLLFLADSVGSVHGLKIHLRIPITVVEDDSVGSHQVQTQASCSGRNQEDELVGIWRNEVVNLRLSVIEVSVTVKSAVRVLHEPAVVFKDIQHSRKS